MAYATNSIMARIEWCRSQRTQARGERETEEWHAEEEGLLDALLNADHSDKYRYSSTGIFERYTIGLQDGRALLRVGGGGHQFRFPGEGQ